MDELLKKLRLSRIGEVYEDWVEKASRENIGYKEFLRNLLEEEVLSRQESGIRKKIRQAGFPFEKTMEQFDFSLRPELQRQVFVNYLDERFITEGRTICLIGAAGLGKTHLSIAIGIKHIMLGCDVKFTTAQSLINRILQAQGSVKRREQIKPFLKCDLLIIDELGYLSQEPEIGPILYEIVAGRYEKKSIIITTNKSIVEWGSILHDPSLATAIVDRLLHHGEVYYMTGESYRLRGKKLTSSSDDINIIKKKNKKFREGG
ncbi:MAG: IS21-like element helper ATPase IstB [Actinomycetota bacterium]